ncbi:hypothetical protein [Leucobacter ruminantium]|uniref:Uncharacterized protein n=1 Tax=Leucobacter ruminantium TaxID=1289170 RepID=A0A939LTD4_9MICO|nr:hypothetical protein [Leucobacter ruminantium]MBO1804449.1 hypothetical protein [Leucobacter ruminantium]
MTFGSRSGGARRPGFGRRILAVISALALGLGALVAGATAAQAATPGLKTVLLYQGNPVTEGQVIPEGAQLTLRVQYSNSEAPIAGTSHTVELGSNVTLGAPPAGATGVSNFMANGNAVTFTFADPWPAGVNQGVFDLNFTVNGVDQTTLEDIEFKLNDESTTVNVVVRNDGDSQENVTEGVAKSRVSPGNLNGFVQRDANGNYTGISPSIIGTPINYRLTVNVPKGETLNDYRIADQLPAYLNYVDGSFTSSLRTWDENGWNRTDTPLSGATTPAAFNPTVNAAERSFTGTMDLVGPAVLTIDYRATVANEADRVALEEALRAKYEERNGAAGNYTLNLDNTATFGPDDTRKRDARISITGNTPGPCIVGCGGTTGFGKGVDWDAPSYEREFITAEDGTIVNAAGAPEPADLTYSFRANLTGFDGRTPNYELNRNVVLVDTLPANAAVTWNTGAAPFIAVTEGTLPLTAGGACTADQADFGTNTTAGTYCVSADGKTLMVNLGQSNQTNVLIAAKASLTSLAGLAQNGETPIQGATRYILPNRANFYVNGNRYDSDRPVYPIELPAEREQGLNDRTAFLKAGPGEVVEVEPGETAKVPYTFTINPARTGVAAADSRIVDVIDHDVFDMSEASDVELQVATIGGTDVTQHISMTLNDDGNLVIQFTEAGKAAVANLTGNLVIRIGLTTWALDGKETLDLHNRATLYGTGENPEYWSEDDQEATSYGDEAEVRKFIYDRGQADWTPTLRAAADADGNLVQERYVYRVDVIARGSFGGVQIIDVVDELPGAVEFVGFVTEANAPTAADPADGPVDIGNGLNASYANGEVTIHQASGTFPEGGRSSVYFAVDVTDGKLPIVNAIGDVEATIVPVGPASVDIEKWTTEENSPGPQYDEETGALLNDGYLGDFDVAPGKGLKAGSPQQINFTVSNDGPDDLRDVTVSDRTVSGAAIEDLVCTFPDGTTGTPDADGKVVWAGGILLPGVQFSCTGTLPALESGQAHSDTARVDAVGVVTGLEVNDEDDWNGYVPVPSIDIEKWTDEGEEPEYDETGKLLNDGFEGDFDEAPGKKLSAGKEQQIRFTVSNDGGEDLVGIVISDKLIGGKGEVENLVCTFPDESKGLEWDGPFAVGEQFECTGTLPALGDSATHADRVTVDGVGAVSGVAVNDADEWHGTTPKPVLTVAGLAVTGGQLGGIIAAALLLLGLGGAAIVLQRRRAQQA